MSQKQTESLLVDFKGRQFPRIQNLFPLINTSLPKQTQTKQQEK